MFICQLRDKLEKGMWPDVPWFKPVTDFQRDMNHQTASDEQQSWRDLWLHCADFQVLLQFKLIPIVFNLWFQFTLICKKFFLLWSCFRWEKYVVLLTPLSSGWLVFFLLYWIVSLFLDNTPVLHSVPLCVVDCTAHCRKQGLWAFKSFIWRSITLKNIEFFADEWKSGHKLASTLCCQGQLVPFHELPQLTSC